MVYRTKYFVVVFFSLSLVFLHFLFQFWYDVWFIQLYIEITSVRKWEKKNMIDHKQKGNMLWLVGAFHFFSFLFFLFFIHSLSLWHPVKTKNFCFSGWASPSLLFTIDFFLCLSFSIRKVNTHIVIDFHHRTTLKHEYLLFYTAGSSYS